MDWRVSRTLLVCIWDSCEALEAKTKVLGLDWAVVMVLVLDECELISGGPRLLEGSRECCAETHLASSYLIRESRAEFKRATVCHHWDPYR